MAIRDAIIKRLQARVNALELAMSELQTDVSDNVNRTSTNTTDIVELMDRVTELESFHTTTTTTTTTTTSTTTTTTTTI